MAEFLGFAPDADRHDASERRYRAFGAVESPRKKDSCDRTRDMATACTNGIDTGFVDLGTTKVAILGVVQGVTELLPISSTAHMRIVPTFLGWPDPGSAFSAAMQLAALFAVVTYFWRDLWNVSRGSYVAVKTGDYRSFEFRMGVGIVIATIPIVIGGVDRKSVV
jgi:undecaprenyl-diphosphatase